MNKLVALVSEKKQFLLYCVCGGTGVATDYLLYHILVREFGVWYQGANIAGYVAGTLVSFVLNRAITFNVRDKAARRLALFLGTAAVGYATSALLLLVLVDYVHLDARLAKLATLPVVVLLQFTLNKRITFS